MSAQEEKNESEDTGQGLAFINLEKILEGFNKSDENIVCTFRRNGCRYFITFEHHLNADATMYKYFFYLVKQQQGSGYTEVVGEAWGWFLYERHDDFRKYKNQIWLQDFLIHEENCGLGSILMEQLISYAKRSHADKIKGKFSFVDDDNAAKRKHFYEKFGFVVRDDRVRVRICLKISRM